MVNITGLDKVVVLAALHNETSALGMGRMHDVGRDMNIDEARSIIDRNVNHNGDRDLYFDYVAGRPLKVDLTGDEFDPRLYDRDAGPGAAQRAIDKALEEATRP